MQKEANYTFHFFPFTNKWSCKIQVGGVYYGDGSLSNTKEEAKLSAENIFKNSHYVLTEDHGLIDLN